MAQASSQWRYFFRLLQTLPEVPLEVTQRLLGSRHKLRRSQRSSSRSRDRAIPGTPLSDLAAKFSKRRRGVGFSGWSWVTIGSLTLIYLNGRLVFATGVGMAVMALIYLLHDWKLTFPTAQLRKVWMTVNQPVLLAIAGGGMATFTTYLAAAIVADSDSPWIALGALMQGGATLGVLVLAAWHILHRQAAREQIEFQQTLADLTHDNPLKRLVAVRQLVQAVLPHAAAVQQRQEGMDYLRLMLSHEPEPVVRDAIFDGLQQLEPAKAIKASSQPIVNPTMNSTATRKPRTVKTRRRAATFLNLGE